VSALRIAVNGLPMTEQPSGVGHYVYHLLRALLAVDRANSYVGWFSSDGAPAALLEGPNLTKLTASGPVRHPIGQVFWESAMLPLALRRRPVDLFFSPSHTLPPFLPPGTATMVTVHDLSFLHHPETKTRRFRLYMQWMVRHALRRASLVAVDSEHTRRDVIAAFGAPADRVITIPLAAAARFGEPVEPAVLERVRRRYGLQAGAIVAVGDVEPRKNLRRLVEAVALLRDRENLRPQLVLVGKPRRGVEALRRAIDERGLGDAVVFTGYVPDDELAAVYRLAGVCVYPSLYEGFGIPPLEAMMCGTPVVASNAASIPEVVGDAALLVDPYSVDEIAQALARLLTDDTLRRELIARGHTRARCFSWEETARRTLEAFAQAVRRGPAARS
jgi:glycosyltransferase involved in cell wall biosynthesis